MASIQAFLRTLIPINKSPAEVMRQVHKLFIHNIRFERFVTFFIGAFDPSTKRLTFSNAGHQPPLVLHKTKSKKESVEMLRPTGAAIGLVEEAAFAEKTIELQEEDLLVLYTDGITEAVNPQNREFGRERLIKMSQRVNNAPVEKVVHEIRHGLEEFSEGKPLADDTTIVICKIKDSEFTFQTGWDDDGEQASTMAHEPRENPSGCWD
jgi:sigma-B regulation protein RsbU (phosphoserine phosphatase)